MIATTSQPGMFPVATSNNPLTLVHTLPPPGSTTVSAQSMTTMPSSSAVGLDAIPVIPEASGMSAMAETPNGKKVYPCSYCDKQFGSRYNASRHEKGCKLAPPGSGGNQSNAEPVLCPNCGKQFQTRDGMTRHLKKKCKLGTPGTVTPSYRWTGKKLHLCKYCGKQFSTKWNAIRHENLFHTSDEPPLSSLMVVPSYEQPMGDQQFVQRKPERFCRFCGNYFSTKYNAIRHERICTRISSSTGIQNQNVSTTETKTTADTSLTPTQITTVDIQTPSTQNVQPTPQPTLQQQIVLHQRPQQQNPPPQQQQQTQVQQQQNQQQQLTQQLQHLQQVQQLQQQVQRQQQQQQQQQQIQQQPQQHEPQQQIIVQQAQNQLQQMQQQTIQQHQVGQQQAQPQQVQITSQQVVFVQPFHVCKFCNKQLPTKCDPTPVLREDIQGGTINAAALQTASLQVQTPITNTVLTGVSLPMLATIPAHNITIPIQPQTPQQQRTQNQQQIVTPQQPQPQQVQHQQVQLQIQPQQVTTQQIAPQQVQQQNQQVQPQQPPQMQPPQQPQQQHAAQTPQQTQAPPRASPVPSSIQQKPHGCKYCNKHFATKWYLDQHVKIHTGQAVTCDVCQKSFVTRWHLDKHVRVHLPGGKKAKRDSGQSVEESRFSRNSSGITITEIRETSQQNNLNGAAESMVTAIPNFTMASDDRNQLQQFGLSPLAQQEQSDK